jgi:hypothetical protein
LPNREYDLHVVGHHWVAVYAVFWLFAGVPKVDAINENYGLHWDGRRQPSEILNHS